MEQVKINDTNDIEVREEDFCAVILVYAIMQIGGFILGAMINM